MNEEGSMHEMSLGRSVVPERDFADVAFSFSSMERKGNCRAVYTSL